MRPDNMIALQKAIQTLPEALECCTTTGGNDAIIKVVAAGT
jgi:hypothetical protein